MILDFGLGECASGARGVVKLVRLDPHHQTRSLGREMLAKEAYGSANSDFKLNLAIHFAAEIARSLHVKKKRETGYRQGKEALKSIAILILVRTKPACFLLIDKETQDKRPETSCMVECGQSTVHVVV